MPKKIPPHIKEEAIQLRLEKQMTVPDIAVHLNVARSTVHGWLKDYPLKERTKKQKNAQKRNTKAMQAMYRKKRENAYDRGWEEAPELFEDPFFRDFVNLYLAEGFKRTIHEVTIGNSNHLVMLMCRHFILKYCNPDNVIEYRMQIHDDQDEDEVRNYWGNILNIPPQSINVQRKTNSGKLAGRNIRSQYGVLVIRANDTYFRQRLQAWMDYLRKLWVDSYGNRS